MCRQDQYIASDREREVKTKIYTQYFIIVATVILLNFLWKFFLEPFLNSANILGGQPENFGDSLEYMLTTTVFCILALIVPLFMALKAESNRQRESAKREGLVSDLQKAVSEIKTLSGIIPICAHCKNIRNNEGVWNQLETYLMAHYSDGAAFSHGICPDCARDLYPGIPLYEENAPITPIHH